jgi:glycosyltransferase involved in cell wall biosynthesis
MAMGLPPVCLDWGGPQLLIQHGVSGYLVPAGTPEQIALGLARHMDALAKDGDAADRMSIEARGQAEAWRWQTLATEWLADIDKSANAG